MASMWKDLTGGLPSQLDEWVGLAGEHDCVKTQLALLRFIVQTKPKKGDPVPLRSDTAKYFGLKYSEVEMAYDVLVSKVIIVQDEALTGHFTMFDMDNAMKYVRGWLTNRLDAWLAMAKMFGLGTLPAGSLAALHFRNAFKQGLHQTIKNLVDPVARDDKLSG